ncbi:OmpW/AlkL family protein [Cupriavidus lacunae]|uniref:OmpW family protein n=1 Tax=Cupriavidus lacunae TaxID=2666307 RepID=A0A370NWX1_9BURK|nr:OmpW family outer membrane protein [Cupriavidus lacunae]RDK10038.1 OmpW family protein [Cupriavidus lacunae]
MECKTERSKIKIYKCCFVVLSIIPAVTSAQNVTLQSDNSRWWIRAGGAWAAFNAGADMKAGGQLIPGASLDVKNNATFMAEFGYRITPSVSLGFTVGIPPTTTMSGTGTVAGVGKLGEVKYGPAVLTLQYQFQALAPYNLYPYLGAGVTYVKIFDTSDGAVSDFQARNAWGGVGQAGLEYRLTKHVGIFVDVKKFILRTRATGYLGQVPVHASARLDPVMLAAGIAFRF